MGGVNCQAQTVTTTTDSEGNSVVTIETTAENQIGVYKSEYGGYWEYSSNITSDQQNSIKTAKTLIIKGKISAADMKAIVTGNTSNIPQCTTLDLSGATIDALTTEATFTEASEGNASVTLTTHCFLQDSKTYAKYDNVETLYLPKLSSEGCVPTAFANAFNSNKLKKVVFPENGNYTCVKEGAFLGMILNEVEFCSGIQTIERYAFTGQGMTNINLKEGLTTIGDYAFNCSTANSKYLLKSVTLPEGVETIGKGAFFNCRSLPEIKFPESLKTVGDYAFEYNDFTTLLFPQNVTYLGASAFQSVSNHITDVYFQGKKAPEVAEDVFGAGAYFGWSGSKTLGTTATRNDFVNNSHWMCMLHYRPDLTADEKKLYEDQTRTYHVPDLYLGNERMWPNQEDYTKAHNNIYYQSTGNAQKGDKDAIHFDGTALDKTELKHIGILRFVLTRADAPIPEDGPEINDDNWWTICLPYTLTEAEVKEAFGDKTQLYALEKITRDYDKEEILLSFTFNVFGNSDRADEFGGDQYYGTTIKHGQLTAWIPYMIKPSKQLDTTTEGAKYLTFGTRLPESGSEVTDFVKATINGTQTDATDPSDGKALTWYYAFRGNCSGTYKTSEGENAGTVYHRPNYCYFLGGKKNASTGKIDVSFYWQNNIAGKVWNPYTCVTLPILHKEGTTASETVGVDDTFYGADGKPSASAKRTSSFFGEDGSTTAIENVRIVTPDQAANGNIYNMSGQLVRANALTTDGLAKGIYICNGKKFVVK